MPNRFLAGYPAPNDAAKIDIIVDHDGPVSYVNSGSFVTSGDQIFASDFGVGGFEDVGSDMMSNDGVNVVEVVLGQNIALGTFMGSPGGIQQPGPISPLAVLHWFTSPTRGTEVTNGTPLNTKFVRLRIVAA